MNFDYENAPCPKCGEVGCLVWLGGAEDDVRYSAMAKDIYITTDGEIIEEDSEYEEDEWEEAFYCESCRSVFYY